MKDIEYFLVAGILFGLIDFIWLSRIMKPRYERELGSLLRKQPDMLAAAGFYVVFLIGLIVFVLHPAQRMDTTTGWVFGHGALYGFFTYATYELTNLSTLRAWPRRTALADWAWGTLLSSLVAGLTAIIV